MGPRVGLDGCGLENIGKKKNSLKTEILTVTDPNIGVA
jgi:hypothetical protein